MECLHCCQSVANSCREDGTTAFERVFMAMERDPKDCIVLLAELLPQEPDFKLADVAANVHHAVQEHPRLRQYLSPSGLWEDVDVDIEKNHLRWVEESVVVHETPVRYTSECLAFLDALATMPAFEDESDMTPRWQVLVSRRRVAMHIHHAAVDGVGLAVIANTLYFGAGLDETVKTMAAQVPKDKPALGFMERVAGMFTSIGSMFRHANAPLQGCLAPLQRSAIVEPDFSADMDYIQYVRLGPYPLDSLRAHAKQHSVTVNSVLLCALSAAVRDYCDGRGDVGLPLTAAIPASFKKPDVDHPEGMKANNDFSTILVKIPDVEEPGSDDDDVDVNVIPAIDPSHWSGGTALGALYAQQALSLLPRPSVRWMVNTASRVTSFIFSNVNGSALGDAYVCKATGSRRKAFAYGYGALNCNVRLFLLACSHGADMHICVTYDQAVVEEDETLIAHLDRRLRTLVP
eukprot:TRINITY_DN44872_c1_g2_i1.p1 TRINITY_DN44872_c1_g2~~TRINITY_DN44872_c1_g2_i1.p1  ORF type:complete len:461 (-),score=66.33 TRINITY_DN44872_c1_g2_i1:119-1501(-)